jgi:hypothetical protein
MELGATQGGTSGSRTGTTASGPSQRASRSHGTLNEVLDFYHAAGHLWRATTALFGDSHTAEAKAWFVKWRHQLRHGKHQQVLAELTRFVNMDAFTGKSLTTLLQVQAYFQRHHRHIHYQKFAQQQIPLGSGMVESTCKWLIQQPSLVTKFMQRPP